MVIFHWPLWSGQQEKRKADVSDILDQQANFSFLLVIRLYSRFFFFACGLFLFIIKYIYTSWWVLESGCCLLSQNSSIDFLDDRFFSPSHSASEAISSSIHTALLLSKKDLLWVPERLFSIVVIVVVVAIFHIRLFILYCLVFLMLLHLSTGCYCLLARLYRSADGKELAAIGFFQLSDSLHETLAFHIL